jgi:hypothetical protein
MKAERVAIVGILFIAMLVVSGANADKPQGQGKPGKPPSKECIVFTDSWTVKLSRCCLNPVHSEHVCVGRNSSPPGALPVTCLDQWAPG